MNQILFLIKQSFQAAKVIHEGDGVMKDEQVLKNTEQLLL